MSILKIKDSQGNWVGVPSIKGDKGDTGNGISSAILNDDYTLTLTFTDGTTYKTPSIRGEKGEKGEPATDMEIHICSASEYDAETRIPTIANPNDKTFYLVPTEDGTSPDLFTEWVYVNGAWEMFGSAKIDLSGYLMDVKVDGQSIVEDGVANIPVAGNKLGLVKVISDYGIGITNTNVLRIAGTTDVYNKAGTNDTRAITPKYQHSSTFYGLAKASGDTTQSQSNNPVGTYTDEAKASIQTMLDVPSNADLDEVEEKVEQNTEDLLKAFPVETASGNIASFEDGANNIPLQSLVVDINPVQDLHGYNSPWVGGAGRNLFGLQGKIDKTFAGVTYTSVKDFLICNGKKYGANLMPLSEASFVLSAGTYYVRAFNVSGSITTGSMSQSNMCLYDSNDTRLLTSLLVAERELILTEDTTVYFGFALNDNIEFSDYTIGIVVSKTSGITEFTPYENICPISGWTQVDVEQRGVNIFDKTQIVDGYISDADGGLKQSQNHSKATDYIPVVPNATYYIKSDQIKGAWGAWYDKDKNFISGITGYIASQTDENKTKIAPSNARYMRLTVEREDGDSYTGNIDTFSVNYPSTDHDYHPYTGRSITIDLGQTIYGGKLDVLTGKLTVDMAMVDLGTLNWTKYLDVTNSVYYAKVSDMDSTRAMAICSRYRLNENWIALNVIPDKTAQTHPSLSYIYIRNEDYPDATAFKTAMNGVQLVYELATPIEIQLSPNQINSLYGVNNIFADTGDTACEYRADPDLYIQRKMPEVPIDDVQINGTSIVANGVANVPIANDDTFGTVKVATGGYYGINYYNNNNKFLKISYAKRGNDIKNGMLEYKPITPTNQHESTFYGLAKVAGSDEKNSTLPIGQYTDNAKDSIQNMLGITPLIASHETDPFESNHVIGELFIINGKLYRAKTALTAGEYVNEGTNVEVVSVAGVLDDTYVKNTDYATNSTGGIIKVNSSFGNNINANGQLYIIDADSNEIKNPNNNIRYKPLTPRRQHEATFYGLAKASGDSTQSTSDNPVGTYTDEAKASIQTMLDVPSKSDIPEVKVDDVQINGTSIVSDGVANVPLADYNVLGVTKLDSSRGIFNNNGFATIYPSLPNDIKLGNSNRRPITPTYQHTSVFYGLAKAAGDTTQSASSNEVGTYTPEAKSAIKQMLSIADNYDSFIVNVEGTDPTITGQPSYRYNCGEVLSLTVTPPETGTIDFRFTSGSSPTVLTLPLTVKMPEWWVEVEANTIYEMCITDGVYCGVMSWAM